MKQQKPNYQELNWEQDSRQMIHSHPQEQNLSQKLILTLVLCKTKIQLKICFCHSRKTEQTLLGEAPANLGHKPHRLKISKT